MKNKFLRALCLGVKYNFSKIHKNVKRKTGNFEPAALTPYFHPSKNLGNQV